VPKEEVAPPEPEAGDGVRSLAGRIADGVQHFVDEFRGRTLVGVEDESHG